MTIDGASEPLALPAVLLAEIEAAAGRENRSAAEVLGEIVEHGLEMRRTQAAVLARVDQAEASLERGEGVAITAASMRELADAVKRRGRARLAEVPTPR